MKFENEDYGFNVSKQNRRTAQVRQGEREVHHMFKRVEHAPDPNFLQRRRHEMEVKAMKRRS